MSSAPAAFSALREAGNQPGLKVWRVNKFNLEAVPKQDIGSFFQGTAHHLANTWLLVWRHLEDPSRSAFAERFRSRLACYTFHIATKCL